MQVKSWFLAQVSTLVTNGLLSTFISFSFFQQILVFSTSCMEVWISTHWAEPGSLRLSTLVSKSTTVIFINLILILSSFMRFHTLYMYISYLCPPSTWGRSVAFGQSFHLSVTHLNHFVSTLYILNIASMRFYILQYEIYMRKKLLLILIHLVKGQGHRTSMKKNIKKSFFHAL